MSYASSKTLYILNYQSVDLVLTTDGIKVDNRPMNQQRLVVHKGFDNQLNFYVRNRDRALQNISTKTLYASVLNPNTRRRVMYKPLTLVSSGTTGEAKLSFVPGDLSDLEPGIYQLAVTESSDSGVTQFPLYANQDDKIITDLEVKSSLEHEPVASQSQTSFTEESSNVYVSSAMYGNQDKNFRHSRHTIAFYMTGFTGNVTIQGSALESTPTQPSDWYDINPTGDGNESKLPFTTFTGIDPFNFTINTNWIRVKYEDNSAGTLDKVLLRN